MAPIAARYEIAISGYTSRFQLSQLSATIDGGPSNARVNMGFSVKVQSKQQALLQPLSNLYVPYKQVASLRGDENVRYTAHFTPRIGKDYPLDLAEQGLLLSLKTGSWLDAIQVNLPQIEVEQWQALIRQLPHKEIIYPLGRRTMRRVSQQGLAGSRKVELLIQSGLGLLLLDNSSGLAGPLNYQEIVRCIYNIFSQSSINVRVAGQLGDNLEVVEQLLKDFPGMSLSWEVESRLRDANNQLSLIKTKQYLNRSFELINQFGS